MRRKPVGSAGRPDVGALARRYQSLELEEMEELPEVDAAGAQAFRENGGAQCGRSDCPGALAEVDLPTGDSDRNRLVSRLVLNSSAVSIDIAGALKEASRRSRSFARIVAGRVRDGALQLRAFAHSAPQQLADSLQIAMLCAGHLADAVPLLAWPMTVSPGDAQPCGRDRDGPRRMDDPRLSAEGRARCLRCVGGRRGIVSRIGAGD